MAQRCRFRVARLALVAALLGRLVATGARADEMAEDTFGSHAFLATIQPSPELETFLKSTIEALLAGDASLRRQQLRVSLIDLPRGAPPRMAGWNGSSQVYPASVVKFVYLMAAYAWQDWGMVAIDADFDRQLGAMIRVSSNHATQAVLRRLTDTEPGPRLGPEAYAEFREHRHRVKRWLEDLGIDDLHTVHPTYDGGSDLHGRDVQFLEDENVPGSLPYSDGPYRNRQAMTADGTAKLLALLATDHAMLPETSAKVRERMRRAVPAHGYQVHRIAGGAGRRNDLEVFAKTGTWGPIFADAGIVRHASGHQLVVVAFVEGSPAYRGGFIAELTRAAVDRLLPPEGS